MARTRTAKHPKPDDIAAEDESQELPEEQEALEATEPDSTSSHGITKAEAVRRALAAGKESPDEGTDYIREQFDIDMAKPHFSAVKSQQRKKEGGVKPAAKGRPGRKPRSQAVDGYLAPPPKPAPSGGIDLLETLEAIKQLVSEHGAEQVHRMVDLVG